jgi:hypothetical protein
VTFAASGEVLSDDFETGDLGGLVVSGGGSRAGAAARRGRAAWTPRSLMGNPYDAWHLGFDPMYKNKGNTCAFSDDWMWAAKPEVSSIQANGFDFFLVSPVLDVSGWTGGVVEYASYFCTPASRADLAATAVRVYDSSAGTWSAWNNVEDPFPDEFGCEAWTLNEAHDLTAFLGQGVDSLQFAWEMIDLSQPGDLTWGKHASVQYLVDNVSFGSFEATATAFMTRVIDLFADTFSTSDPAHTPFLQNADQGMWSGVGCPGFTRPFAQPDSLAVTVSDFDGVTAANVVLWWRHDDGGAGFGAWNAKAMDLSVPDPVSATDEGTYRQILGADDGGVEDAEGTAGNCRIWKAGTTVEYYVKATDDAGGETTFSSNAASGAALEFSVLPLGHETPFHQRILLVDDYNRANLLDFRNSSGFDPQGGIGFGGFSNPAFLEPEVLVRDALAAVFQVGSGADIIDTYDVQGAGSSVQCEPRGAADSARGLGAYTDDDGAPYYNAIIWLQGTFDTHSYADTTRLELGEYLDRGGKLLSTGDQVAFHLGAGGNNADSAIGFLGEYLGTSFPSPADETTDIRMLEAEGEPGSVLQGVLLHVYGECPIRRKFDRLTLATPDALSENAVLMRYVGGSINDNGRPAVVLNRRFEDLVHTRPAGAAIHMGFGISSVYSLLSHFLRPALSDVLGLRVPHTGAPDPGLAAHGYAFRLGAASPSPFREATSIGFGMAKRTHVSIEIYDLLGRRVRTIVDEPLEPGTHVRRWDGRTDEGLEVASGIYFYRMVAGDFRDTKKVVVLR